MAGVRPAAFGDDKPNDATDVGQEDGVLGQTVTGAGAATDEPTVVEDSAVALGNVVDDENEGQVATDTAVFISGVDVAGETVKAAQGLANTLADGEDRAGSEVTLEGGVRATADSTSSVAGEVVADEGEGVTDGDGEPTAAGEMTAHGGMITADSAANQVVAAAAKGEAVTVGDDVGGRATNVAASAARSDEDTVVNVERLAARSNPEQASREQIGDPDIVVDIPSQQEPREETASTTLPTVQDSRHRPIIIAKVRPLTRNVNKMDYEPHHVSIGPYHRLDNPLLAKDDEKEICLEAVLVAKPGVTKQEYLAALASLEDEARSCFDDPFSFESEEFVRMLLLDGCYLLCRFGNVDDAGPQRNGTTDASGHHVERGYYRSSSSAVQDPAGDGGKRMDDIAVVRDTLFLAENQIPFFVVEKIHQLMASDRDTSAADTIAGYVRELLEMYYYSVAAPPLEMPLGPGNLLHLLHMHLKPSMLSSDTSNNGVAPTGERVGRWRSATEYHKVGVKFKCRAVRADDAQCILDVKLHGGVLEIPRLNIHGETSRLLRNLMALEQRNSVVGSHVTAYCVFMSQLASKESDVELLSMQGVIQHVIGNDDEVATLFSDLCKGIVFDANKPKENYLLAYCQKLEKRYKSLLHRWMTWLEHKYFSNPCLAIGLAVGAVGLFCAVLQTIYTVLGYYKSGAG